MTLVLNGITKSFKDDLVLDDISFTLEKGKTLVLFGPSGAGKTVLLRLIAGVIDPDEGEIIINGENMHLVEPEDRGVGMAFQNFALFPHMDAETNIASPLEARKLSASSKSARVKEVASLLKIDHVLHHKPKELSNGQKQRTALARALSGEPSILLLDDPLRNVDAKLRFEMRLELPRLLADQQATVVYVTQDYKEAMALGHHIAVLSDNSIQQIGTPEEIYLAPESTDIASLFGDPVINFLDVVPQKDKNETVISLSGQQLKLGKKYENTIGHECILGIRPEAISFVESDNGEAIPVTVEAETPLNEKTVTLSRTQRGREVMISRPSGSPGPDSREAFIKIDTSAVMLFDKNTRKRFAPAGEIA